MQLKTTSSKFIGDKEDSSSSLFLTKFAEVESPRKIETTLANHALKYAIKNDDSILNFQSSDDLHTFITSGRCKSDNFYRIIIGTKTSKHSTTGLHQFKAYQRIKPSQIDKTKAGTVNVQIGIGYITSIGSSLIETPIGTIGFHILPADNFLLLSLLVMDKLRVYYDKTKNLLGAPSSKFLVIQRFGQAF